MNIFKMSAILVFVAGCATNNTPSTSMQQAAGEPDGYSGSMPHTPDLQKVKLLVQNGSDINETSYWGTALNSAVRYGNYDIVEYLLNNGSKVEDKNIQITPLMTAAELGKFNEVKLLVSKGADVNAIARNGNSPLYQALYHGRYEMSKYLIDHGADPSRIPAYAIVSDGMVVIMTKQFYDASPGSRPQEKIQIPYEHIAILDMLASRKVNVNTVGSDGENALHKAAAWGNPELVRYFLKAGVNPNAISKRALTPLDRAKESMQSHLDMLTRLNDTSDIASTRNNFEKVAAILKPLTTVSRATLTTTGSLMAPANAVPASNTSLSSSMLTSASDTLAECVKLKASLNICERMPWPLSSGCNSLAKAQYSNSICKS